MLQETIDTKKELTDIVKRKAIGPKGSRHLTAKDLPAIHAAMKDPDVALATKAVLLAAVQILDRNDIEEQLLEAWHSQNAFLPGPLHELLKQNLNGFFPALLNKVLQNQDLTFEEARQALPYLWDQQIRDFQKAIFLIGERLKRETFDENRAFLKSLRNHTQTQKVDVPFLVDLSDPYDGFKRYPIYTPFTASLLAAMNIPVYCHGVNRLAPKFGDTIAKILKLAGKKTAKSLPAVQLDIENSAIGWGYIDQSNYFPELFSLQTLRENIIKRPFLATIEKLLQPLQSTGQNYLVTGFVHSHYKKELARLLKNQDELDSVLIVKGMEGSSQVDFRKEAEGVLIEAGESKNYNFLSRSIPYPKEEWENQPSLAAYALETGRAALQGKHNTARNILINQAVHITIGLGIYPEINIAEKAAELLDSGQAFDHWRRGCN